MLPIPLKARVMELRARASSSILMPNLSGLPVFARTRTKFPRLALADRDSARQSGPLAGTEGCRRSQLRDATALHGSVNRGSALYCDFLYFSVDARSPSLR